MSPDELVKTIKREMRKEARLVNKRRQIVEHRFPFIYTLLVSVGAVATFTGLSRLIDGVDYLNRNPWVLLAFGLLILAITGSVYRKLR